MFCSFFLTTLLIVHRSFLLLRKAMVKTYFLCVDIAVNSLCDKDKKYSKIICVPQDSTFPPALRYM